MSHLHRIAALAFCVATMLAVAGCTDEPPTQTPVTARPTTDKTETSAATTVPTTPALILPAGRKVLVPVTEASTNLTLPRFTLKGNSYTVHLLCKGGGKISLLANKSVADTWPCDGVPIRHAVLDDDPEQQLAVRLNGKGEWALGVVEGAF